VLLTNTGPSRPRPRTKDWTVKAKDWTLKARDSEYVLKDSSQFKTGTKAKNNNTAIYAFDPKKSLKSVYRLLHIYCIIIHHSLRYRLQPAFCVIISQRPKSYMKENSFCATYRA